MRDQMYNDAKKKGLQHLIKSMRGKMAGPEEEEGMGGLPGMEEEMTGDEYAEEGMEEEGSEYEEGMEEEMPGDEYAEEGMEDEEGGPGDELGGMVKEFMQGRPPKNSGKSMTIIAEKSKMKPKDKGKGKGKKYA